MKILLVIGDGMADRPADELGGKTPLQYAKMEFVNSVVKDSMVGLMDPIAPGIRPGSDTSHLSILGYDPFEVYTGRGPFEAAGLGMELKPGDIAFRCNFATVDEKLIVKDRRAGRIKEGTEELIREINGMEIDGVKFFVKPGVEHRAALVMRGENLSPYVSDADPHKIGEKVIIKIDPSIHRGMPFKRFHGKVGEIIEKRGRSYVILVRDGKKYKKVIARQEHIRPISMKLSTSR